jgi:hypothetical protein
MEVAETILAQGLLGASLGWGAESLLS